ncbi:protein kinase [Micromonospora sp. NPDC000089]|uniref:protein kinase domain-containing protein n=1 Tax=unclassified Micromonospora TaxID=2617518 RepID=UPI00367FD243
MSKRVLDGRYRPDELLGSGGMGEVWRGHDLRLDRSVAIKVLSAAALREPKAAERFDREARAAARLNHPHIVAVYDFGTDEDGSFLVMELVEGRTVSALIADGPLPVDRAVAIGAQAADGIAAAHAAGVVHRDVKPANLLVTPPGTVKICDFGIARLAPAAGVATLTGPVSKLGTSSYMSPEQALGRPADHRSDLYALGCTLYAMLAGRPPYLGDPLAVLHQHVNESPPPLRDLRPGLPAALESLVTELLAKDPADRPSDAATVRDRLAALAPPSARPASPAPALPAQRAEADPIAAPAAAAAAAAPPPVGRQRAALLTTAGVLGATLLALAAVVLLRPDSGPSGAPPTGLSATPSSASTPPSTTTAPAAPAATPGTASTTRPTRTVAPAAPSVPTTTTTTATASRRPGPPSATPAPAPPADPVVAMRLSIQKHVATGQLNPDAARDLNKKVDAVAKEIAEGDRRAATDQIKKLRDKLTELRGGGKLGATGYAELSAGVDRIAAEV